MRKVNLLLVFLFLCIPSFAQITVVSGGTAASLAGRLIGSGVTVTSAVLTCASAAYSAFSGTSVLSFDSGIVLTTGKVTDVNKHASYFASTANNTSGDAQLSTIAGGASTNDACVLEFDFIPVGDTIKFDYVFGSEEYTNFTCTAYNDVFAFFISGPGYAGPTNIALIPGTAIPVCINSVNCSTGAPCTALVGPGSPYCSYYINNTAGTTIVYDGLTTTLTQCKLLFRLSFKIRYC
jgi:hypothetical protein